MQISWWEQCAADVPAEDDWLGPSEQLRLSTMPIPKRLADWRLGRWTAKQAVASCLGLSLDPITLATIELRPTASGAPVAYLAGIPAGISISLSHRAGIGVCAVAPSGVMLGCDLELIEPRSEAFVADYFTVGEQALIASAPQSNRPAVVALLWSAKESVLKSLRVGLRLDTRSVAITLGDDWPAGIAVGVARSTHPGEANSSRAREDWCAFRANCESNPVLFGCWQRSAELIRTAATDSEVSPSILRITRHEAQPGGTANVR
jgi:4'-phosphopantetheinyl transferase